MCLRSNPFWDQKKKHFPTRVRYENITPTKNPRNILILFLDLIRRCIRHTFRRKILHISCRKLSIQGVSLAYVCQTSKSSTPYCCKGNAIPLHCWTPQQQCRYPRFWMILQPIYLHRFVLESSGPTTAHTSTLCGSFCTLSAQRIGIYIYIVWQRWFLSSMLRDIWHTHNLPEGIWTQWKCCQIKCYQKTQRGRLFHYPTLSPFLEWKLHWSNHRAVVDEATQSSRWPCTWPWSHSEHTSQVCTRHSSVCTYL